MTKEKRNNLIITLTISVVLICSGTTFLLIKSNDTPKKLAGHLLTFPADSGEFGIDKFANLRNCTVFTLTTDSATNTKMLEQARQKLNSIKNNRDTINGIHIVIANNTPYKFFIKAIDICSEKEPRAFAPYKNDIYAWYLDVIPMDKRPKNTRDK